ncbi:MAG: HEAT repeat domain-containing protein [Planctomycetota bacterium]
MAIEEKLASLLGPEVDPVQAGLRLRELAEIDIEGAVAVLAQLSSAAEVLEVSDPAIVGTLLRIAHTRLVADRQLVIDLNPDVLGRLDESLPERASNRHLLLHLLAFARTEASLRKLVEILNARSPENWMAVAQVLSPLMQHDDWPLDAVFPAIFQGLGQPALAASLLDLANHVTRRGRAERHPATEFTNGLNELLGQVASRLGFFEENPRAFGDDVQTVQKTLGEAVALAVALCDALALIGDASSIGKLNQTIELRHRRVQCEAAGALARLGDEAGRKRLIELAGDPAARLRAIAYADELGFGDEIDESNRSDDAMAEAELALWLSQPHQMGVPPTTVEVAETRRLLWPSFENPVDVTLVRFEYNMGDRCYSNIGLTGPATYTMSCDLADLPMDDIFAIYAGWHAEHEDIFAVTADSFNEAQHRVMESFSQHLQHLGYEEIKSELLGIFLDEHAGVFTATREGVACVVASDGLETIDQPTAGRARPLAADDLFNLYKGRKMLRTFNA